MVKRSKGIRSGTRKKLKKKLKDRGKIKIKAHLQSFKIGDHVLVKVDSSYQKGMPFKRFFGKQGKVLEKRGKSYVLSMKDGNKSKKVISSAVHLRKI